MTSAGNANASNHSGTFRQENFSRIALLEKRLGGDVSPLNASGNAVASQQLAVNDGRSGGALNPDLPGTASDPKHLRGGRLPTRHAANPSNLNRPNDSNSSGGHLVSDTPLHSAEEGKTKDGERETTVNMVEKPDKPDKPDKVAGNSNKKRRVSKTPMRVVGDERSNGGRRSMGGKRVTVDLTKEDAKGEAQQHQNDDQQEKRTPNQLQKSIERYLTLSNKQGSNQSVEEGVTHTSKDKGVSKEAIESNEKRGKKQEQARAGMASDGKEGTAKSVPSSSVEKNRIKSLEKQAASLKEENTHLHDQLKKTQAACDVLEEQVKRDGAGNNTGSGIEVSRALDNTRMSFVVELAKEHAVMSREIKMRQLQEDAPRLGTLSVQRKGIDVQEVWENGAAIFKLGESYKNLQGQREQIDALRKAAKRRLPLPGQPVPPRMDETMDSISDTGPINPDDWMVQEEILKARLAAIKREEDALKAENIRLETEKNLHIRELKRLRDEEQSRFGDHPVMNKRYLLLELLGKGGFSEVFKALDLSTLTHVAVKIHQLSSQWSESKKASYVKHSVREYHIHKGLHHPRIVSLLDIFEIDNNTFATVLEHCPGGDLEGYVKKHETLPEKEARSIVSQIISGLLYLNVRQRSQTYIHYDLKPANILFDAVGQCKITDFGLSKVVEDGQTQGMELTSQGAGTYWYLPPECFDVQRTPMISNKVDVWSVGVILYQMVYGKRPFGHELSQEQILRNEVMRNATEVQFPAKPSTSSDCKDFIKQCLAYRQQDRPDVHEISKHKWLATGTKKR